MIAWAYALVGALSAASGNTAAPITQFDFGSYHRCAVTAAGAVQCLADSNVFGQVGDGTAGEQARTRPATVIAHGASKVVAGNFFNCAIVDDTLQCWGDIGGQPHDKPYTVIASGVRDAAAGDDRVCAIVGDAAQCIGAGARSGSDEYARLHPVAYTEIEHGVSAIAVGHRHACAVAGGALLCWGDVPFDASGRGERMTRTAEPVRVIEHDATSVAAGAGHDCAIADGALWCWGDNSHGQVGVGVDAASAQSSPNRPEPAPPQHKQKAHSDAAPRRSGAFDDGAQRCSAPAYHVDACWVSRPVKVLEHGVTRVFAKDDETCALVEGALRCWGANALGQLGIAAPGEQIAAPIVAIARGVSDVAVSGTRTCALVNGALQCTRRCVAREGGACRPDQPGFDARDLAFGLSDAEARVGVWRGTIGTQEVSVCLGRPQQDDGRYYYLRHGRTLQLEALAIGGADWREQEDQAQTGTWRLDAPDGDRLGGTWLSPDGSKTLPITLARVRGTDGATLECERFADGAAVAAWNAPRVAAVKRETSAPTDGLRTVSVLNDQISIVEFAADEPHARAFNAAMRAWLDDQIGAYFDCAEATSRDTAVDFVQQRQIELRAGPWVIVHESFDLFCGGAHPSEGTSYLTWNLDSDKAIEPWTWIAGSKVKCDYAPDCGYAAPAQLNEVLLRKASRNKDGDECADAVNENSGYGLRPSATGLIFDTQFAHVIQACDEDIELSYDELAPFLTAKGKAQLKSLIDAASKH